jgi:hypothetical protein
MILDGDEVYPSRIFNKLDFSEKYFGIYLRNHMCVGDVFHKLPEKYGRYEICGKKGHFNMRFYRKMPGWKWYGRYPLEYYGNENGISLDTRCDKLQFVDDYYWHMSFMERSSIKSRNHIKYDFGEKIIDTLPEVFSGKALNNRSISYIARSLFETPIRNIKNSI